MFGTNIRDGVDYELNNDCLNKGWIVDNVVQRSSGVKMIVCKNDVWDRYATGISMFILVHMP